MADFLKQYGETEGPLGVPMKDAQAKAIDQLLKALPEEDRKLRRLVTAKATSEVLDGERSDVSWITTESIDRENEIVLAKGMNDSQFAVNPLVTMNHCYWQPPIGRSLWRKRAKNGAVAGIKAKTQYPAMPADWTGDCWPPDAAFSLVKAGMLVGKSVGFLCLKSHCPSSHEIAARPQLATVDRIVDEWLLLEYACTFLPMNQDAVVEAVSKSNTTVPKDWLPTIAVQTKQAQFIPFTTLGQLEQAIKDRMAGINPNDIVVRAAKQASDRVRGII